MSMVQERAVHGACHRSCCSFLGFPSLKRTDCETRRWRRRAVARCSLRLIDSREARAAPEAHENLAQLRELNQLGACGGAPQLANALCLNLVEWWQTPCRSDQGSEGTRDRTFVRAPHLKQDVPFKSQLWLEKAPFVKTDSRLFCSLDKDHDGTITAEEAREAGKGRAKQVFQGLGQFCVLGTQPSE